jgi:hypothetical protein
LSILLRSDRIAAAFANARTLLPGNRKKHSGQPALSSHLDGKLPRKCIAGWTATNRAEVIVGNAPETPDAEAEIKRLRGWLQRIADGRSPNPAIAAWDALNTRNHAPEDSIGRMRSALKRIADGGPSADLEAIAREALT